MTFASILAYKASVRATSALARALSAAALADDDRVCLEVVEPECRDSTSGLSSVCC